jgi:hypothetical protein
MRRTILAFLGFVAITSVALAGTEYSGKEMKQTAAVQPQCWYGDNEWNVNLWGTYAFTGTSSHGVGPADVFFGTTLGDRYLETDHAWGGGGDIKYFWHKYFGFGVEGFVLDAKRTRFDLDFPTANPSGFLFNKTEDRRAVGSVLGTFTLRYPIGCSRFAPYVWGGGGVIFGGGQRDNEVKGFITQTETPTGTTEHTSGEGKGMAQVGGGFEVRITRHIGWTNDFSWNIIDGPRNNFGMARSGINFAF